MFEMVFCVQHEQCDAVNERIGRNFSTSQRWQVREGEEECPCALD